MSDPGVQASPWVVLQEVARQMLRLWQSWAAQGSSLGRGRGEEPTDRTLAAAHDPRIKAAASLSGLPLIRAARRSAWRSIVLGWPHRAVGRAAVLPCL